MRRPTLRPFALILGCLAAALPAAAQDYWPTGGWRASAPEAQGLDPGALSAFDAELAAGKHGYVDSMLVIRNGHVVFERAYRHDYDRLFAGRDQTRGPYNYYDPDWHPYYRRGELHTMQSVSKSVTSALIGIAIRQRGIPGVDAKVLPYFDGFRIPDRDPRREAMTIRDLLTMTAGIKWDESTVTYTDPANSCAQMEQSRDWIQYVLDQPMAGQPGARFVYNSGATQLLSYILKKATGREAHQFAAERLFTPLGIKTHFWKTTPLGLADTEGGLYLTPRDLAKIGYLYLNDGIWEKRRLLPEGWVAASVAPAVTISETSPRRYGYKWWLLPNGSGGYAWLANGYGGQYLIVVPEQRLIAVFTGWNIYDRPALNPQLALDRVLAAIKGASRTRAAS
jgi:CubicO group peptidase (beta-lactamase class C family)